jgi:hypothetical protein
MHCNDPGAKSQCRPAARKNGQLFFKMNAPPTLTKESAAAMQEA